VQFALLRQVQLGFKLGMLTKLTESPDEADENT
jgi:hypothetical protein